MATKLSRMVTYLECLLPIKSNDHTIMWFQEITWQTKTLHLRKDKAYVHKMWQDNAYLG